MKTSIPVAVLIALVGTVPAAADVRVVADVDYVAGAEYAGGKDRLDIYVPDGARRAASPARHLQRAVPAMLLIYADGDDEWRRMQNDEMAAAMRSAGRRDVAVHEIKQRTHTTVWTTMQSREDDEVSSLIVAFVNRLTSSSTSR